MERNCESINKTAKRTFATGRHQVWYGGTYFHACRCGKLADAVQVTLGPKGRNVVIDQPSVHQKSLNGVTVALEFSDPLKTWVHNLYAQFK